MRRVEFEPVGAGLGRAPGGGDEIRFDAVHVVAVHRLRRLAVRQIGHGGSGDERPAAFVERLVDALPGDLGRPLPARMAELDPDLGGRVRMNEIGDPPPGRRLRVVPQAEATRA